MILARLEPNDAVLRKRTAVDPETLKAASAMVNDVRTRGEAALRDHATRLGDIHDGEPLVLDKTDLRKALDSFPAGERGVLERTAGRIERFAEAQKRSLLDLKLDFPGGSAGHFSVPVNSAGCYAPGGRFPLPSSVLMTALTAKIAGVKSVWVASPKPAQATVAAAALAGADALLRVGGAQAIAALAYGAGPVPACDVIVGPGNRWVTAAKKLVAGDVGIDMLAGPSELVVVADRTADPAVVASDLLAQAEHDPDAVPILVALDGKVIAKVEEELEHQIATLPTAETARRAVAGGFVVEVSGVSEAAAVCDRIAPEHLELHFTGAREAARKFSHFGGMFIGGDSAEVLGDYGAGPNHVLPTGGTARFSSGLSVFTFVKTRTWLGISDRATAAQLVSDAISLGRMEGLEAHARSAARRR